MNIKIINTRLRFFLTLILFLFGTSARADELFKNIRAFDPSSIRQWRIEDNIRAMTVPGRYGNPTNQNISETCQLSNTGALNGNPCCRHLETQQCTLAVSRGLCPSGFRYDIDNKCNDGCNDPPIPSPSVKPPSPSPSRTPSPSPSVLPSVIRPLVCVCKRKGAPDFYRGQSMCISQVGVCDKDDRGQELENCDKTRRECDQPPPPPPITRSPVSTGSIVVVRSGTPTRSGIPTRSSNPTLTRTPAGSASRTPSFRNTSTPYPSVRASFYSPTVTPQRLNTAN